ncbi:HAAS signaling domain-containing protein [Undibacterium sp. TJN19]|uniref:HAAS signaling domain-containing protein n=1 Tax=Undibacterium sp. TJN19 TaxID=3413055 RepID=UPI003BEFD9C1
MNLLQNYISAVKRELPEAQRDDIARELQANILDQIDSLREQLGRDINQDELAALLEKLGHPGKVAASYRPATALVSSELMPFYHQVLFSAFGIVLLLQSLKSGMTFLQAEHFRIMQALLQLLSGFVDQSAKVFVVVTLLFYAASVRAAKTGKPGWLTQGTWRVQDLPDQPHEWQAIRGTDIITDLANCGFALLLIWHAFWMPAQSLNGLPVDFSPAMASYFPWMTVLLSYSIAFCLWCLLQPRWDKKKLVLNIAQNILYAVLFLLFAQLDTRFVTTAQGMATMSDLPRLDHAVRLACAAYALYLMYQVFRDGQRWLQLHGDSALIHTSRQ